MRSGSGSSSGSSASAGQQHLLVLGQGLLGQVALPLDFQLQGLWDVGNDPINGSQHKEDHMLQEREKKMNLLVRSERINSSRSAGVTIAIDALVAGSD